MGWSRSNTVSGAELGRISGGKVAGVGRFRGQRSRASVFENSFEVPNVFGSKAVFRDGYGCPLAFRTTGIAIVLAVSLNVVGRE